VTCEAKTKARRHVASDAASPFAGAVDAGAVRCAVLEALNLIVEGARAGRPDIDEQCQRFADAFAQSVLEATAAAYLRATAAVEQRLGVSAGLAN